jgi:hypothetical protein
MLSKIDRSRITFLNERIKKNYATIEEYQEFEEIALRNGFTHEHIQKVLQRDHLNGYDELLRERKRYAERKRNAFIETDVVSGIIGIGIAVLLYDLFKPSK